MECLCQVVPAVSFKSSLNISCTTHILSNTLFAAFSQPSTKTFLTILPHQHSFTRSQSSAPSSSNIILERCLLLSLWFHEGLLLWEEGGASWLTATLPPQVLLCVCLYFHSRSRHWNTCNFHHASARADELWKRARTCTYTHRHTLSAARLFILFILWIIVSTELCSKM